MMCHRCTVALLGICTLSCNNDATVGTWAGSITDSAGITIVQNDVTGTTVPTWSIEPELIIGVIDGPEEYVFGEIA